MSAMRWSMVVASVLFALALTACGSHRVAPTVARKVGVSATGAPKTCAPDLSLSGPWTVRTYSNCAQTYYSTDALIPSVAGNPVTLFGQEKADFGTGARPVCSEFGAMLTGPNAWTADASVTTCTQMFLDDTPAQVDPYVKSNPAAGYLATVRYKEQISAPPAWAANLFSPSGSCAPGVFAVSQPGQGMDANGNPAYAAVLVRVYAGCEAAFRPMGEAGSPWAPIPRQAPPAGKCAVWLSGQWVLKAQGQCATE